MFSSKIKCMGTQIISQAIIHISVLVMVVVATTNGTIAKGGGAELPVLQPSLPFNTIFSFAKQGSWIENVAVRSNGDILFTTLLPSPTLFILLHPPSTASPGDYLFWPMAQLATVPNTTGLLGITAISRDKFVIAGGKFLQPGVIEPGTASLWLVKITNTRTPGNNPAIEFGWHKIVDLPSWCFPNGILSLPGAARNDEPENSVILIANSLGSLIRVDLADPRPETIASIPEMRPVPTAPLPIGINGVKVFDGHLYLSNSFASTIWRTPINSTSGYLDLNNSSDIADQASPELVAYLPDTMIDDFAIRHDGAIFACTNANNTVVAIRHTRRSGGGVVVAGRNDQMALAGPVSASFGTSLADRDVLYVVTAGGMADPINGTLIEPAKVVRMDTSSFAGA